ncbi:hypothetical protein A2191_04960 [Candidatus Woesebacteria bacterium RIFOXYA1_FULL_38_9]|nr:MAG: hypothetical protein A2191_04960 [Candidatus Woesebacteria bacterium RIFOXYA1_FULL_38_9]
MNTLNTTIPASKARANFYNLLDDVANKLSRYTITKHGKAQVVLMHPEEVSSWEETIEILADPKLTKQILQSETERKTNKIYTEKDLLKKLNISPKTI